MFIPQSVIDQMDKRALSDIDRVIIHHSVADKTLDIERIAQMEMDSQGFLTVGYNAYTKCVDVAKDLWVVQQGRPLNCVPAAAYGMNSNSYNICIGGNYHPGGASFIDNVSDHALRTVASQIAQVKSKCPNLKYLIGHRDVASIEAHMGRNPSLYSTACPGDRLYACLHELRELTGLGNYPGLK